MIHNLQKLHMNFDLESIDIYSFNFKVVTMLCTTNEKEISSSGWSSILGLRRCHRVKPRFLQTTFKSSYFL